MTVDQTAQFLRGTLSVGELQYLECLPAKVGAATIACQPLLQAGPIPSFEEFVNPVGLNYERKIELVFDRESLVIAGMVQVTSTASQPHGGPVAASNHGKSR